VDIRDADEEAAPIPVLAFEFDLSVLRDRRRVLLR
jgi:hypothetical protein